MGNNGEMIKLEVIGSVKLKTYLEGNPSITVTFNKKVMQLTYINFHKTVNCSTFDDDRMISFQSEEGHMTLANYRRIMPHDSKIPFRIFWDIKKSSDFIVEIIIRLKSDYKPKLKADNILLKLPLPTREKIQGVSCAYTRDAKDIEEEIETSHKHDEVEKCVNWYLKKVPGDQEQSLTVKLIFVKPVPEHYKKLFQAVHMTQFEVPMKTMSGIKFKDFKIESPSSTKWIKYATMASDGYSSRFIK